MKICFLILFAFVAIGTSHNVPVCTPECPPCDTARLNACGPLPSDCEEYVAEPGCGCCFTCALKEGSRCGVYTHHCGSGMKCLGAGNKISLSDLLANKGVCTKVGKELGDHEIFKRSVEQRRVSRRISRRRRHPHVGFYKPLNYNGPCSRHFARIVTACVPYPTNSWIPHCDDEGYYDKTQCMTSSGLVQGECWCVDRSGETIEGTNFVRGDPQCSLLQN